MEKWAKTLNAQKEAIKGFSTKAILANSRFEKESATADAGFAILEKSVSVCFLTEHLPNILKQLFAVLYFVL